MTITYSLEVSKARLCGFAKLLGRWRGSIYRLMYREMIIFIVLFYAIAFFYRYALQEAQKRVFETTSVYFREFTSLIPITFVMGFYVYMVVTRWWEQYLAIPWPDRCVLQISAYIQGNDERGRLIRRSLARYLNLMTVLTFQVYTGAASSYVNYKSHTELEGFSLRSTRHNLAARFQARENIRITGLLFPTVALQWAIWMVDALSAVVGKLLLDSPVTIAIGAVSIPQLTATLWPMYALAHPVLILAGDERLRKDMRAMLCGCKMFGGGLPQNVVDFRISPDANNDLINRFWEKAKANI